MIEIIPSLLDVDEASFLTHVTGLGHSVEMIQIDIADGVFVPNKTWADPEIIQKHLALTCELHLMVADPLVEATRWQGVPQVRRVLIHYESVHDVANAITSLKTYGWEIGLVLKPKTPIDVLKPHLASIQTVMFMGVEPGFQGQAFIPETLNRIREFKKISSLPVAVDGGVNETTLPDLVAAGADILCPGSAIFGNDRTPAENVRRMREVIERLTS